MPASPESRVLQALQREPQELRWFRAPGRVNLMGDHTDYNDGFVLPAAIDLACTIAAERADALEVVTVDDVGADWKRYLDGVVEALGRRGVQTTAIRAALSSDVPPGSGLSSSAALEVALALALVDAAGARLEPRELALACQEAEHLATGVPSGIMDQLASVCGREGHALLLDCRTLELTYVAIPSDLVLLVVHSGLPRTLEGSEYAARRAECERIARGLGVAALRDATIEQVADEPLARHVVSENARVHETAAALEHGDLDRVGELFLASHRSLRDDYRVSTPELDVLVEELVSAGAAGARLTGAGFGGCVVAVAARSDAAGILDRASSRYAATTGRSPTVWLCEPSSGAGRLRPPSRTP